MQRHSESRVWLITGISRGLGLTMAKAVLSTGDSVAGTTRDGNVPFTSEKLRVFKWDAEEQESQQALVSDVLQHFGRIDELKIMQSTVCWGRLRQHLRRILPASSRLTFRLTFMRPCI